MVIEACIECNKKRKKFSKEEIKREIDWFLENPNDFYVRFNPITGYYKFERIK